MNQPVLRIGLGCDRHLLVEGRPLWIGGVAIPHPRGLLGHSDADVLLHAAIDAILGAAGLDDIGTLFPDRDPRYRDADSKALARTALALVHGAGFAVISLDGVLLADEPKIAPYRAAIRHSLAGLFQLGEDAVNVKAKTTEGVGPQAVIDATVVALLQRG